MLEFIRKIFQKEEEQENKKLIEINLQNLYEWIDEKSKPVMEDINQKIKEVLMNLKEEIERTKLNLEFLEHSKLQNPNIPFKAKQYMEGNRKTYIRAISSFLGRLEINNRDYFYLLDYCREFGELMAELNKSTLRSYTILQEFLANETSRIAENLKNFDTIFNELKSILKSKNIVAINDVKEKIKNLNAKAKQKINLNIDIKGLKADLELAGKEKEALLEDIEKFNKNEEHNNFLSLNEEKIIKTKVFNDDEKQILQSFSNLERPLRKYSHFVFEHEEITLNYLKQPIETLANDKKLEILQILKNLAKHLQEGKLQIDEKKKEKVLEDINKLNKEYLQQFLKKYLAFKNEMDDIDNKMKASGIKEKIKNFNKKLEDTNARLERNKEEFDELNNDFIKTINLFENIKKEIEKDLKEIFNQEIRVIF